MARYCRFTFLLCFVDVCFATQCTRVYQLNVQFLSGKLTMLWNCLYILTEMEMYRIYYKYWDTLTPYYSCPIICKSLFHNLGMAGCGEGFVYLTSPGRPTDIGLHLASPAILVAGKSRGENVFISSVSSLLLIFLFIPFPSLSSPLLSLFSLSLGDDTKCPTRVDVSLNPNKIKPLPIDVLNILLDG